MMDLSTAYEMIATSVTRKQHPRIFLNVSKSLLNLTLLIGAMERTMMSLQDALIA